MLVLYPDPILKQVCAPVEVFDEELKQLVAKMDKIMADQCGVGLAANQIGISKRVIVAFIPAEADEESYPWHGEELTFVNPEIVERDNGHQSSRLEGCLSFPNVTALVKRAKWVRVKAQDVEGQSFEMKAHGLLSVCLQHEIDHLNGVTFIERAVGSRS